EKDIDAIAITYGPGLIGSLLVGVETAKTLSFAFNKPIVPVNHLLAHLFANFIAVNREPKTVNFPFIGLIVSGGHTDLLYFESIGKFKWLGGTRDDAAGEALDKVGRLLGLKYPAGAEIERRAKIGSKTKIRFKSPIMDEETFDFSFSGLKTEVLRYVQKNLTVNGERITNNDLVNKICFAVQKAVIDVLVKKTLDATRKYNCKTILLGGGVSANKTLLEQFKVHSSQFTVITPKQEYCTDNGAMIGAYALLNYKPKNYQKIHAEPDLYFD
ncbi:MAG: tRNA (adenosine(37)-N6)-threonylcarbamoyltransferase complex transferase subunit TsaD, partial [Candidatus Levyibacteriota bacterium]